MPLYVFLFTDLPQIFTLMVGDMVELVTEDGEKPLLAKVAMMDGVYKRAYVRMKDSSQLAFSLYSLSAKPAPRKILL